MSCLNFNLKEFLSKPLLTTTDDRLDVIIFGATGFVGRCVVFQASEVLRDYSWGVAGRCQGKLQAMLQTVGDYADADLSNIPVLIADMEDKKSIVRMVARCRIIVNCCGPSSELGEFVIQACIGTGTHYVDPSFEPHFSESIQVKYHDEAERQNVYIVCGCGLFSLPVDVGINYIEHNFEGTINSVEAYVQYWSIDDIFLCRGLSSTAWSSFILSCAHVKHLPAIRQMLFSRPMPDLEPKISYKSFLYESDIVDGVCVPFPFTDTPVVQRSQYHFFTQDLPKRPIQFQYYVVFPYNILALIFIGWCALIGLLAQLECTRNILLKYPNVFSCGFFSDKGPDLNCMERTFFKLTLKALGWANPAVSSDILVAGPPTKRVIAKIGGRNPLYNVTCVCLIASAVTIIADTLNLPSCGGVYPPGAAFAHTDIVLELMKDNNGLSFQIIEK